jgi:hypothetical protein
MSKRKINLKNLIIIFFIKKTCDVYIIIQWKPLNVIALVPSQSDNINRMITIAKLAENL